MCVRIIESDALLDERRAVLCTCALPSGCVRVLYGNSDVGGVGDGDCIKTRKKYKGGTKTG